MRSCRSSARASRGWLGDDDDIHAVLSGLAGRDALRGMLARLQPKEEVLLLGWGVPMPLLCAPGVMMNSSGKSCKATRQKQDAARSPKT